MSYTLASNTEYYKYIFKKTEKIVCAVFYILENQRQERQKSSDSLLTKDTESSAVAALDHALASLRERDDTAEPSLFNLRHMLLVLESKLRLMAASGALSSAQLHVFVDEIDSVVRTLQHYMDSERRVDPFSSLYDETVQKQEYRSGSGVRSGGDTRAGGMRDMGGMGGASTYQMSHTPSASPRERGESGSGEKLPDRRTRIIELLQGIGEASIKDISGTITDCSEKTIQRELNALIKDNIVQRKGQRRWSTYSVVSD